MSVSYGLRMSAWNAVKWLKSLAFFLAMHLPYHADADDLQVGLVRDTLGEEILVREWIWALRGGGATFRLLAPEEVSSPGRDLPLLILDSIPLGTAAREGLERWVREGGILIYADAKSAMTEMTSGGNFVARRQVVAQDLFGLRFSTMSLDTRGTYPFIVESSPLLSPLLAGDGLRLGIAGVDQSIVLEATTAKILAKTARLSPGPGSLVIKSDAPTITVNEHGRGRVIFLSFSPGQIAACYPAFRESEVPRDCSGAANAHALMRWLTANVLWEYRRLQIPLYFEAPGNRPHAVIVTGDVHDKPNDTSQMEHALSMAVLFDSLELPLSFYIVGSAAKHSPEIFSRLKQFSRLEISSHTSAYRRFYTVDRFRELGALGIFSDIQKAHEQLGIADYPGSRRWLISFRSHGWNSDEGAWNSYYKQGIGLVFDDVADRLITGSPFQLPRIWFEGGERERLRVPLFEKGVMTGKPHFPSGSFMLAEHHRDDVGSLASAQPEPCCSHLPYPTYTGYVERWNRVWDRLATLGGLTEVWLWHPGGIGARNAWSEVRKSVLAMYNTPSIQFMRGDVVASWRANRERHAIRPQRESGGKIIGMTLDITRPGIDFPPGTPANAKSIGYWVLGPLRVNGWSSVSWDDPHGRQVTLLTHSLVAKP